MPGSQGPMRSLNSHPQDLFHLPFLPNRLAAFMTQWISHGRALYLCGHKVASRAAFVHHAEDSQDPQRRYCLGARHLVPLVADWCWYFCHFCHLCIRCSYIHDRNSFWCCLWPAHRPPLEWSWAGHYLLCTAEKVEGGLFLGTAGCWQDYYQRGG